MADQPVLVPYIAFPADPPALLTRQPGDPGGPEYITHAVLRSSHENTLDFAGITTEGRTLAITLQAIAPGILHIVMTDPLINASHRVALVRPPVHQPPHTTLTQDDPLVWTMAELRVHVTLRPFHLAIYGADGQLLLDQAGEQRDPQGRLRVLPLGKTSVGGKHVAFHETFLAAPDEHYYGFGEQFTDLDKRGQRMTMWNYDAAGTFFERAYKNVPFFISSRGYGILVDSVTPTQFDMAASNTSVISFIVPDTALDYYVIAGPAPKTVLTRYADLVGYPTLPPKWAFGLWMSSGFTPDTAAQALARADHLRERHIPADVMHLDCYWQRFGEWSNFQWDEDAFPNPAGLIRDLKERHFHICLWINSYISVASPLFATASAKSYLLQSATGEPYALDLWFGFHPPVGLIDITNPAAADWFRELLRPLLRMGIDVFKTDFGEGVPSDAVAFNGLTGVQLHNLYPLLYNDLVAAVTAEETGSPLVWARSSFTGGQRHVAQWGGDTSATDQGMASTLRGGLSISMSGFAFWSHDIGGFHGQPSPAVYERWSQFGMLSPLARAHGETSRLPWDFGEHAEALFRDSVRLRYSLLPYLYSCALEAVSTGVPLLRAMIVEYPDDPVVATLDLQYCLGADLLVAPRFDASPTRWVYFPLGQWIDYWTNTIITGPQMRLVTITDEHIPLYVRANAIIPMMTPGDWVEDGPFQQVHLTGYVINEGHVVMHDDDGDTVLAVTGEGSRILLTITTPKPLLTIRLMALPGVLPVNDIWLDDAPIPHHDAPLADHLDGTAWSRQPDGGVSIVVAQG